MMRQELMLLALVAGGGTVAAPAPCAAQARLFSVSRPIAAERFLHVTLDFGGGTLVLAPAATGALYAMQLRYDGEHAVPIQQYDPRTGILHIGVEPVSGSGVLVASRGDQPQTARIALSPTTPLALFANLGAGDATLDLGGLTLTELEVRSTATHAVLDFSAPTRGNCRSAVFAVAAAQVEVHHLAQAACDTIRVDGTVGAVTLAFDGTWRRDLALTVDMSMGGLTLQLPRGTGVRIAADRFLAPLKGEGLVRTGNTWSTPNFEQAAHKLRVEMKAAMVKTSVEWR
jgi:hypothetical protein